MSKTLVKKFLDKDQVTLTDEQNRQGFSVLKKYLNFLIN